MTAELRDKWARIERCLRAAQSALPHLDSRTTKPDPRQLVGSLDEFVEFMDHGEWELAWDALSSLAIQHENRGAFWVPMADAADLMQLESKRRQAVEMESPAYAETHHSN